MKEQSISIDSTTCIKCGKCVRVCPSRVFVQRMAEVGGVEAVDAAQRASTLIPMVDISFGCIACGHCVAACPSGSIAHSDFPTQSIHEINYATMPTPEQVMLLCKTRRSNRAFSHRPLPEQMLDMILEAAHRAPTASNMQQVEFTLVTDPEQLSYITDFTIDTFRSVAKKLKTPILKTLLKAIIPDIYRYVSSFDRIVSARTKGDDMILRGATAVIFIHTPKESRFGNIDANLAYENGSLMAESLGISQFYTGFVCTAIKQGDKDKLAKHFGIKGTIHAGMALGMSSFRFPNYIDKKDIVVTKFSVKS